MKKRVVIFGARGVIGKEVGFELRERFDVVNVDIEQKKANETNYFQLSECNFEQDLFSLPTYAIIFAHQYKSPTFIDTNLLNLTKTEYHKLMESNVDTTLFASKAYASTIQKDREPGRIIFFTSTYSTIGSNPSLYKNTQMGNPIHYTMSKAAIFGMMRYLASNYQTYNILSNSISPHGIENNQDQHFKVNFSSRSPLGRLSMPSEVVPAVNFLLDEKNTYTNGLDLSVDGGWRAC